MSPRRTPRKGLRLDRAIRLVWSSGAWLAVANLVLVAVQGLLPLAALYAVKRVVDALQAGVAGTGSLRDALVWVGIAAGVALLTALFRALAEICGQAQALTLSDLVADVVHERSARVDFGFYEDSRFHDTLHRAQAEAPFRPVSIVNGLVGIGQSGISLAGVAGLLVALSPLLAIALAVVAIPAALVRLAWARRFYRFEREQTGRERRAWYYHLLLTDSNHAGELRLFDLGALFRARYRDLRRALRQGRLALVRRRGVAGFLAQAVATLAVFAALAFIARQAWLGSISIGSLVMYFSAMQLAVGSVQSILTGLAGLYEDNLFLADFYDFLALEPKVAAPANPAPVPRKLEHGIVFRDVGFSYPGAPGRVLETVDLSIGPGEVVALVGENGSGKTTLVKLLCRLYDPDSGVVTVDDTDLRELDPARWRREISVILQDFARYQLPAWENIWLGDASSEPDRDRIVAAAERAGADPAIRRLPRGYDTPLGRWFESGRELSSGEWQKIALARAFLRRSQLVVLDEPTSALDPLAEAELFERFRKVLAGRSAVLVSHRFSTVTMADRIYVLDQGRVVEHGPHRELLALDGLYARMYRAQSARYRES